MSWTLTARVGGRVRRETFATLDEALDALEREAERQVAGAPGEAVEGRVKRFEASERVHARLEVAGPQRLLPSVRGGVDVHGDGSMIAYTGRVRRSPLPGRRPLEALRRQLA